MNGDRRGVVDQTVMTDDEDLTGIGVEREKVVETAR
jgi:hypothetical protein